VGGRELAHVAQRRERSRHVAEGEIAVERDVVDLARDLGVLQERLHLRCEAEHPVAQRVEHRLLADAIAGDHEQLAARVPQREGEHAVQVAHAVGAVLLVEVDDDLGVTLRGQRVAARGEVVAQLAVVVDLAVHHDDHRAVLVVDRLVSRAEVDDPQALDAQAGAALAVHAARVGPAVLEAGAHALDEVRGDALPGRAKLSDDATHVCQATVGPERFSRAPAHWPQMTRAAAAAEASRPTPR
jgi:hypothetical protein